MNRDDRTTADYVRLELHLNPFSFRETTSRYRVQSEEAWIKLIGKEGEYLAREFDTYAVLLYPIDRIPRELLLSLSERLNSIDRLREALMKPMDWKDFVTFRVREGLITSWDLRLQDFIGRDLVNGVLNPAGLEFVEVDDGIEVSCKLDSFRSESLDSAFRAISLALGLYFDLKPLQEDISLKLAKEYLERISRD
ncbi:hypothetical protein [Metallosphaera hakonensis]|uniref:Uncharacterized protein n=1 Tax=Metallosphaera hakonensis JCM 8857 = DSM 7519 TaxID=1293036 RepID=A0A2U9IRT1_9CREN|nr:hypothetical protein [Metallosphaera hakonensis]AWR98751.1 hypothetical protein DFR87_02560 [Metallosphaera hakonensis JCM 8857 = DSM 7519]